MMVREANDWYFKGMGKDLPYYLTIEVISENVVLTRTQVSKAD